jgi:predicted metal-binding membrane protein
VASSWALMAALFPLGVMSVGWMVLVAALIATEQLLPWWTVATRGIAPVLERDHDPISSASARRCSVFKLALC